jgi:hypothetical protein
MIGALDRSPHFDVVVRLGAAPGNRPPFTMPRSTRRSGEATMLEPLAAVPWYRGISTRRCVIHIGGF